MRRPLFGTGFPQSVPVVASPIVNPDSCLEVLNLQDLTEELQQYTRFLTLFAHQITAGSVVDVYVQQGSETPFRVARLDAPTAVDEAQPRSCTFPVRGNVRVYAASVATAAAIFGYYELDTDQPTIEVARPLQPADPLSPFNVVPFSIGVSESLPVHAFLEGYTDTVTIDWSVDQGEGTPTASVDFPNGVSLLIPVTNAILNGQYNMMTGIPMMPSDSDQTIIATTNEDIDELIISGLFTRT